MIIVKISVSSFLKEFLCVKRLYDVSVEKLSKLFFLRFNQLFQTRKTSADVSNEALGFFFFFSSFLPPRSCGLVKLLSRLRMDRRRFLRPISGDLQRDSDAVGGRRALAAPDGPPLRQGRNRCGSITQTNGRFLPERRRNTSNCKHNSRSQLQVSCPPTPSSHR